MIAAISSLGQAVDTLIEVVTAISGKNVAPADVATLAQEVFLSWTNLRPELKGRGVDPEIVERLDKLFTSLVRLTTDTASKRSYRTLLSSIREVVMGGLHDFGIKVALLPVPIIGSTISRLIPEISDLPNEFVPRPLLGWLPQMRKFLGQSPFENNAFVMVPYREKLSGLITSIATTVRKLGLNPVIARDNELTDDLYNPIANLLCCKYGIAIFDRGEAGQKYNANVVYEMAAMQTLGRPCVLLKHKQAATMPSDFLHKLHRPYRTEIEAVAQLKAWFQLVKPEADR